MADLKNKKITVVGLGEKTGVWLLRYLLKGGAKVFVTEMKTREELLPAWHLVSGMDAEFEFGGHSLHKVAGSSTVVLCPGVPIDSPFVKSVIKSGVEVLSELEFAFRQLSQGKVVAVTGTNGKSTTMTMIGDILKEWGKKAFVGGNLGDPLIEALVVGGKYDFYVVEVSTFQLEGTVRFRPDIGVILNISQNHLDRHGSMDNYVNLKFKLLENQTGSDIAILNGEDDFISRGAGKIKSKKIIFSSRLKDSEIYLDGDFVSGKIIPGGKKIPVAKLSLAGLHNVENFMAASAACISLGCPLEAIERAMTKFKPLPHRIEFVREFDGVKYFDDSKSTTVDSTMRAMASIEGDLILIAGGRDKGSDFTVLKGSLKKNVKGVVLFGEAAAKMEKQLAGSAQLYRAGGLPEAVSKARGIASNGDTILLSPANTSFDLFRDYKERGDCFKKIVQGF